MTRANQRGASGWRCPPHVRNGTVRCETLPGLLEMTADHIERIQRHDHSRLKRSDVHRHEPGSMSIVIAKHLVVRLNVRRWNVVLSKQIAIEIGIDVPRLLVFIEAKRLVVSNREAGLFRHIGFKHLCTPVAVIDLDEFLHHVMQETRR